jgi:hypothetical protein
MIRSVPLHVKIATSVTGVAFKRTAAYDLSDHRERGDHGPQFARHWSGAFNARDQYAIKSLLAC